MIKYAIITLPNINASKKIVCEHLERISFGRMVLTKIALHFQWTEVIKSYSLSTPPVSLFLAPFFYVADSCRDDFWIMCLSEDMKMLKMKRRL